MTPERIAQLRQHARNSPVPSELAFRECLDEIERLDNITRIQQEQISRLLTARDAEQLRAMNAEKQLAVKVEGRDCSST